MKCRQCGHPSSPGAKFCSECGSALTDHSGDTTTILGAIDESESEVNAKDMEEARELTPGDALLIIRRGGSDGERFLIDTDVTTVGRHPKSDIFLDDITVSRHHAKFIRESGGLYLEDMGSLNGTYVNRKVVDGRTRLTQGDEIQIGKFRATLVLSEAGHS